MKLLTKKLNFFKFFFIVFLFKSILVILWGYHYEQDTPRYLLNIRHLYNPPLYPIVLRLLTKIYVNLYSVILLQTLIFSILVSLFSCFGKKNSIFYSLFWAFEPISAFFCSNLMSEWLFLAILWASYILWYFYNENSNFKNLTLFTCSAFLLYMTRYVGITWFIYFIFYQFFFNKSNPWKHLILSILIFFILTIPVRVVHYYTFQTFRVSAYDGLNLWNSVSVLYPKSSVQKNPQNEFERFLLNFSDSIFSTENALLTHHMWNDSFPALAFASKYHLNPVEINDIVQNTAIRLINENSWSSYFYYFVLPNFLKIFKLKEEKINIEPTYFYIENFFGKHQRPDFVYRYEWILMLLFIILIHLIYKPLDYLNGYILFYWIFISFTSAIFMRYLYVVFPLGLLIFFEGILKINERNEFK